MLNSRAGVLRLEAQLGYKRQQEQQEPVGYFVGPASEHVACEQGQVQEGPTYVVNPLQLLLKQTLPDRD